jgi:PAS domain S-box-containing protein
MSGLERIALDNCAQMILLVEAHSLRIAMANRVAVETLGYSADQLLAKSILDVESALPDVFYWEEVRAGQLSRIESQEGLYLRADGSLHAVNKSVTPVEQDGQRWLLVQAREIDEERSVEDVLARTASQLRATLESTGNGILVIDWQGRIASMNRLFSTMWGVPQELLLAHDDAAILDFVFSRAVDDGVIRQRVREVVEGGPTEDIVKLADGRVFECKSLPQYLDDRIIGRVFGFNDISERIRIEGDLIAAREKAEAANEAKAAFLAMMSHEIRTPMNGVMGMTTLMLDTPLNSEQRRFLEIIHASSEALLSIINDILDFSKIEAGKLTLEAIDFDLRDLLEQVADLHAVRAAQKGVEFAWCLDARVPERLHGDPGRIRQILNNLIGNALKFTAQGVISLRLGCPPCRGKDVPLTIEVEDTGVGIAAESVARIFEPFEQADSTTTRRYGGTGLGLAICKQLVELMHGEISVSSRIGRGTVFRLTVVLGKALGDGGAPAPEIAALDAFSGARILVLDDNAVLVAGLLHQLVAWGFDAEGAADALSAQRRIEAARQSDRPFRCLLLDDGLPDGAGQRLTQRLIDDYPGSAPAVVLLRGAGFRDADRPGAPPAHAVSLIKPVKRAALADALLASFGKPRVLPCPADDAQAGAVSAAPAWQQGVELLVVEDNPVNMAVLTGVLAKLGYTRIGQASDGIDAVDAVRARRYDLILMDCQMPGLDGYEATRQMRALGIGTPIVAMTAHALSGDRERCLAAGMNDYLTKPVVVAALAACLERWLAPMLPAHDEPTSAAAEDTPRADGQNDARDADFCYDDFLALMMDDVELADSLIRMFVANTPGDIDRLKAAIASGDGQKIRSAAHFIKGSSANLCASRLNAAAFEIEQAGKSGEGERAASLLASFEACWQAFLRHPRVVRSLALNA